MEEIEKIGLIILIIGIVIMVVFGWLLYKELKEWIRPGGVKQIKRRRGGKRNGYKNNK